MELAIKEQIEKEFKVEKGKLTSKAINVELKESVKDLYKEKQLLRKLLSKIHTEFYSYIKHTKKSKLTTSFESYTALSKVLKNYKSFFNSLYKVLKREKVIKDYNDFRKLLISFFAKPITIFKNFVLSILFVRHNVNLPEHWISLKKCFFIEFKEINESEILNERQKMEKLGELNKNYVELFEKYCYQCWNKNFSLNNG